MKTLKDTKRELLENPAVQIAYRAQAVEASVLVSIGSEAIRV